ncbi:transposase [Streptomyces sp. VNUA24]|uniref:transposase n=1 Tax=Streptomyces sp. VNUA24 TaxID=3031131 RepID=UPI0023B7EC4F|nr:transposase [Streptomyces sp. VNUA24]WEH12248.1 transposase [Streptomyces sp. VNUA24]
MTIQQPSEAVMPRGNPPEFRCEVLDLVASGRKVAEVAQLLGISDQTIFVWRRQHLIDTGQLPDTTSSGRSELAAARERIAELEADLAIHRRATELLGEVTPPKDAVRSHPHDGPRAPAGAAGPPGSACRRVRYYAWRDRPPSNRLIKHASG